MLGNNLGVIISLLILFYFTVNLDPKLSWPIIGSFFIFLSLITLILVVEPKDVNNKFKE